MCGVALTIVLVSAISCYCLFGCSIYDLNKVNDSNIENIVSEVEIATADHSSLTERQKKILSEESLPTEINKLTDKQKSGIMAIEDALLYLDEKYPGVEFEFGSLQLEGIMGKQHVRFVPAGYDRSDARNVVEVVKERGEHKYTDDYMLIPVRESIENVIRKYLESYFGKDSFKVYVHPAGTDLKYGDEINEESVIGNVQSSAALFLTSDSCSEEKLDKFADEYNKKMDIYKCNFRATIISQEDFDNLTYKNYTDLYVPKHIIYDVLIY